MRNYGRFFQVCLSLLCVSLLRPAPAGAVEIATDKEDRTLSPYFHVKSDDPDTDRLPLKETRADVNISGVIAHVRVTQVYENEGKSPLEAVYVFPGSTRSAVFAMRMKIGKRLIDAEIKKKDAARKIYEKAKSEGKSASLLEQKRPNVFQMNVANIMPGDKIKVQLDYVEALVPDEGVYEFIYPTVVGPRYSEKTALADPDETWIENPHLEAGAAPPYRWDLRANIHAGMPIQKLRSPSHEVAPTFTGKSSAKLDLDDPQGGNRDFVLRYRLAGGKVQTGMLLYPGEKENFFLAMVQPPERVEKELRPPREYVFILDVSGSMRGFPLNTAKGVMRELLGGLQKGDRLNVMMFSGGSTVLSPRSLPATPQNVQRAIRFVDSRHGGGGTRIRQALQKALAMPRSRQMSTSFVVVTDGYVAVEKETFELIRENLGEANLFSFGIGSSVNRFLVEGMARAGMGEPFVVLDQSQAAEKADRFKSYIESPVLTDVGVKFRGFRAYDVVPSSVPDLFAQRPLLIFGKYRGRPTGRVRITGRSGRGRYAKTLKVADFTGGAKDNEALRYLWARHKIRELSDYRKVGGGSKLAQTIERLGLRYNLMTEFTSFVAVDKRVRNKGGKIVAVRQPLPMPEGVPNSAIGRASGRPASAPLAASRSRRKRKVYRSPRGRYGGGGVGVAGGVARPKVAEKAAEPEPSVEENDEARAPRPTAARVARAARLRAAQLQRQLGKSPKARGKLRFELVIAKSGRVVKVRVLHSTIKSKRLERLLLRSLRRMRFGAFSGKRLRVRTTITL